MPIVYVTEATPGKSHALNTAVARAHGDLLVFTDDDVLPSPGWLAAYVRSFTETDADFAAGRVLPLWEAPAPAWLSPDLYAALSIVDGGTRRVRLVKGAADFIMPIGANMAVRRRVFDRVGGWNPDLGKLQGTLRTGEDHEFMLKMIAAGFTGVYEPEASVRHRVPADRLRLPYFAAGSGTTASSRQASSGSIRRRIDTSSGCLATSGLSVLARCWRQHGQSPPGTRRGPRRPVRLAWFGGYLRGLWNHRRAGVAHKRWIRAI